MKRWIPWIAVGCLTMCALLIGAVLIGQRVYSAATTGVASVGSSIVLEVAKPWSFEAVEQQADPRLWNTTTRDEARKGIEDLDKLFGPVERIHDATVKRIGASKTLQGDQTTAIVDVRAECKKHADVTIRVFLVRTTSEWKISGLTAFKSP